MTYETVILEQRDAVTVLTLNRPDRLNSWNVQMRQEIGAAIAEVAGDDGVRALVITGAGRGFSAGEDVTGMAGLTEIGTRAYRRIARGIHNVFDEIEAMETPVIAALNGVAAGGGMELALSCDFRIAAAGAKLGFPENRVGLIPGSGGCSRLVKLVGPAKAKRLVMIGEMTAAATALDLGLVDEVVADGTALDRALEFAGELAAKAPLAIGLAKLVINACVNADLETGRTLERLGQSVLKTSADHAEGARAFVEKRQPDFKGK